MKLGEIFLGKPWHWLLWAVIVAVLFGLGSHSLHVRSFVPFLLTLLALAAGGVLLIVSSHRKGERITRDPFEKE